MDCIFCKIAEGSIPSNKVYEDDKILAFHDLSPQAPVHILVIPKMHIENLNGITSENKDIAGYIFEKIPEIAKMAGVESYRIVSNCGLDARQSVFHLHFHLLGGKELSNQMA